MFYAVKVKIFSFIISGELHFGETLVKSGDLSYVVLCQIHVIVIEEGMGKR